MITICVLGDLHGCWDDIDESYYGSSAIFVAISLNEGSGSERDC
jgi:hypothetical protein